jgi:hypothetical protein
MSHTDDTIEPDIVGTSPATIARWCVTNFHDMEGYDFSGDKNWV